MISCRIDKLNENAELILSLIDDKLQVSVNVNDEHLSKSINQVHARVI